MATAKVLGLTELLEPILLRLPTRDLLFAQAVCRTWQQVITTSIHIRRALFLEPGAAADVVEDAAVPTVQHHTSSLVRSAHNLNFVPRLPSGEIAVNPLLFDYKISKTKHYYHPVFFDESYTGYRMTRGAITAKDHGDHASCLRMYLSQPPVGLEMHVKFKVDAPIPYGTKAIQVGQPGSGGIRLADCLADLEQSISDQGWKKNGKGKSIIALGFSQPR
ncbi:hypothetical protein LTR91_017966 [Friedmanniomyces endolithicus]|uniref:F-box domain-containing protein n=1 Tax=Friedmanniomyces endolithicus TaxID=329885 RepID=A0AAN6HDF4_9PEZI|nr:hypothetical protein LTR94_008610 [Friedmanniomyces endolithicus]KAK0791240.1 hypothetical protein LTR59_008965 [Friedmanniomyces endolithicus]KAK0797501.1 hypothetical protein LTR38_008204 [Friedmanniomyces endolithicus]KAK0816285.1 hypothetical protein LTR75_003509 [Friedmanniomyces endolithicus]KAK0833403.1 hypothetical protein LTR03_014793 [Friedmanniomyces endolithicus]